MVWTKWLTSWRWPQVLQKELSLRLILEREDESKSLWLGQQSSQRWKNFSSRPHQSWSGSLGQVLFTPSFPLDHHERLHDAHNLQQVGPKVDNFWLTPCTSKFTKTFNECDFVPTMTVEGQSVTGSPDARCVHLWSPRSEVQISGRSNRIQCCLQLATAATFLRKTLCCPGTMTRK